VDNSDLGVGEGQRCDAATGSGCDYTSFGFDHSTPPAPEPGPSNIPRLRQVFDPEPDSKVEANEGPNEGLERSDEYAVYFLPDVEPETEVEIHGIGLEDPRDSRGEEARQLDVERSIYHILLLPYMFFFVPVSRDHRVSEWGLTVNQNQKRDCIRKQLRRDTSSIYEKSTCFLQLAPKLRRWTAREGLYLQKKIAYTRLSLPSTGRESKRRGRGELDPDRVQPPDCHFRPMCSIPSRRTDRYF